MRQTLAKYTPGWSFVLSETDKWRTNCAWLVQVWTAGVGVAVVVGSTVAGGFWVNVEVGGSASVKVGNGEFVGVASSPDVAVAFDWKAPTSA